MGMYFEDDKLFRWFSFTANWVHACAYQFYFLGIACAYQITINSAPIDLRSERKWLAFYTANNKCSHVLNLYYTIFANFHIK
jgi:hypothetical protein